MDAPYLVEQKMILVEVVVVLCLQACSMVYIKFIVHCC